MVVTCWFNGRCFDHIVIVIYDDVIYPVSGIRVFRILPTFECPRISAGERR